MLSHPPKFTYCGLTVILSNPSRFDNNQLLSAGGGKLFDSLLRPDYNRYQCDIRVKEDVRPILPGTKCILLLGEQAAKQYIGNTDNSLGAIRGSIFYKDNIPMLATFFPQDAADIKDYERQFNEQVNASVQEDFGNEEDEKDSLGDKKRHGKTKRKNYRFWISKDFEKVKYILKNGIPKPLFKPNYILQPSYEKINSLLRDTVDHCMFVDLETDYPGLNPKCISISFIPHNISKVEVVDIYCLPLLMPDHSVGYSGIGTLLSSFARAANRNRVIAHNGQGFDFPYLCWKLGIPLGKDLYDTMIMQHRCFSDVEKSLGHSTSLWTYEMFHKDEGDVGYSNIEQCKQTMLYCCKDVYTMALIYYSILNYAKKVPGLTKSIEEACNAIYPYLVMMLSGFEYDVSLVQNTIQENDRLMMHYLNFLEILIGKDNLKKIAGKSKSALPTSNKQCIEYFHNMLGYPVVGKGAERADGSRGPSLGKKNMYKLSIKHPLNPCIQLCLIYRELARETGSLKFTSWKRNSYSVNQLNLNDASH